LKNSNQHSLDFGDIAPKLEKINVKKGLLITFEGGEGVGKSTQANNLYQQLEKYGVDSIITQEPGGSLLGNSIRKWIKSSGNISPLSETLLFEAARSQIMTEIIMPALKQNKVVIVDRFIDSTISYQGFGHGLDIEVINKLNKIATKNITPDLTILLDIDPEIALSRVSNQTDLFTEEKNIKKRVDSENQRRFEQSPLEFHKKVREGYLSTSKNEKRWYVINANQKSDDISKLILDITKKLLIKNGVSEIRLED
tara:strand:+ start:526 stop:1287 length:762 start_codon:yes stop_codon:yes gene_type:complete